MKRRNALILGLLGATWGLPQTLYLRYGGPESLYHVRKVTADNPSVITVFRDSDNAEIHDLLDGQLVWMHFVPGCMRFSGLWIVVNANQSAGTFSLIDLNGNHLRCTTFDPSFESGLVGKVTQVTLRSARPRIFLPPNGPLLDRSKDPDGRGPAVAPVVSENGSAWRRIISRLKPYITPGCDGTTKLLCPNEELALDRDECAHRALAAAYVWFADNSQTGFLNLARYLINHIHRCSVGTTGAWLKGIQSFPCDQTALHCGLGSGADWISASNGRISLAYDLIRDQLSAAERLEFAEKMLNGLDGSNCTNALEKQDGSANLTQGSKTVTGSGFSVYSPGDWIYIKTNMKINAVGRWGNVVTVSSDNEMTVNFAVGSAITAASDVTVAAVDHYKVIPWQSGQCGANFIAAGHADFVPSAQPRGISRLSSAITAEQTKITVDSTADFLDSPPFYIVVGSSEVMRVAGVSGNTLAVERGQAYSTRQPHSAGVSVVWSRMFRAWNDLRTSGPRAYVSDYHQNVVAQKTIGYMIPTFALAGDDPRAADYAQGLWNYYYDLLYPLHKRYWSGPTQGGLQNAGYQFGRWQSLHLLVGLLSRHAFVEGPIDLLEDYFFRGLTTLFLWTPPCGPGHWKNMPVEPSLSSTVLDSRYMDWAAAAATLYPSDASAWWQYWFRNLANLGWTDVRGTAVMAAYSPAYAPSRDFRLELQPWSFHTDTDYISNEYYGLVISKTDWSETAGMLLANTGWHWPVDHTLDQGTAVPGGYAIWKGSKLLFGWDNPYGVGGSASMTPWLALGSGASSLKSSMHPPWFSTSHGGQQNKTDRRHADDRYLYARGDFTGSWRPEVKVVRQHRHFVHWKREPEYVVVYDDVELALAGNATSTLQYFDRYDAAAVFTASNGYRQIVFKKPTGQAAMISTHVLLADGGNPRVEYTRTSNVHRVAFQWTGVHRIKTIAVHNVALGTSESSQVTLLTVLDPGSVGFESDSSGEPLAVVFPVNGEDRTACWFATNFARRGWILVAGLAPGSYWVYRDGEAIAASPFQVAPEDGTLLMNGPAGLYVVGRIGPKTLVVGSHGLGL